MKLMYAVRGSDLADRLTDPDLHERLRTLGARRLQLNLDDGGVAPAMRLATGPDHVGAVVSVWTDAGEEEVSRVLTDLLTDHLGPARQVSGWEVEEHRPIPPPDVPDGERADALTNVALLRRPADLDHDEWRHRWLVDHSPVAMATQATLGYVQNLVVRAVAEGAADLADVAALVEELFPSEAMTDMHAFYGSGGDDAELNDRLTRLMASCARFGADRDLELVPSSRYVFELAESR